MIHCSCWLLSSPWRLPAVRADQAQAVCAPSASRRAARRAAPRLPTRWPRPTTSSCCGRRLAERGRHRRGPSRPPAGDGARPGLGGYPGRTGRALRARRAACARPSSAANAALKQDPEHAEAHRVLGLIYADLAAREPDGVAPRPRTRATGSRRSITSRRRSSRRPAITAAGDAPDAGADLHAGVGVRQGHCRAQAAAGRQPVAARRAWRCWRRPTRVPGRPPTPSRCSRKRVRDRAVVLRVARRDATRRTKRFADAAAAYEKALGAEPARHRSQDALAFALLSMPEDPARSRARATCCARSPRPIRPQGWPLYLLARAQRALGDLDAAEATARRLLAISPAARPARTRWRRCSRRGASGRRSSRPSSRSPRNPPARGREADTALDPDAPGLRVPRGRPASRCRGGLRARVDARPAGSSTSRCTSRRRLSPRSSTTRRWPSCAAARGRTRATPRSPVSRPTRCGASGDSTRARPCSGRLADASPGDAAPVAGARRVPTRPRSGIRRPRRSSRTPSAGFPDDLGRAVPVRRDARAAEASMPTPRRSSARSSRRTRSTRRRSTTSATRWSSAASRLDEALGTHQAGRRPRSVQRRVPRQPRMGVPQAQPARPGGGAASPRGGAAAARLGRPGPLGRLPRAQGPHRRGRRGVAPRARRRRRADRSRASSTARSARPRRSPGRTRRGAGGDGGARGGRGGGRGGHRDGGVRDDGADQACPTAPGCPSPAGRPSSSPPPPRAAACARMTAEVAVRGQVGGSRLRGRVLAGFERGGALRLEAPAPFGAPDLRADRAGEPRHPWLPRDRRILRDAPVADLLEAIAGLRRSGDDLAGPAVGLPHRRPAGRTERCTSQRDGLADGRAAR